MNIDDKKILIYLKYYSLNYISLEKIALNLIKPKLERLLIKGFIKKDKFNNYSINN